MAELQQWSVKYRPQTMEDFIGNDDIYDRVTKLIAARDKHAILISGPTGCGKTTLGKMIAYGLARVPYGTQTSDIREVNVGDKRGVDDIRALTESSRYLPSATDGRRIMLLDEAHQLTGQSASALLKPLEEPSPATVWILATDQPERLLGTIVNRCYPIRVDLADPEELRKTLSWVLREEDALQDWEPADRRKLCEGVVRASGQIPRAAMQILQAAVDSCDRDTKVDELLAGPVMNASLDVDKAAIRVILALMIRAHTGKTMLKQLTTTMLRQDAFGLLRRMVWISNNMVLEMASGEQQPGSFYFNNAAKEVYAAQNITNPHLWAMTDIFDSLLRAQVSMKDFAVDPRHLLTAVLLRLHDQLKDG